MEESIFDKLRSLGVQVGAKNLSLRPNRSRKNPVELVVNGENIVSELGEVFVHRSEYASGYRHGKCDLTTVGYQSFLSYCLQMPELNEIGQDEILYLDTETSGLSGGAGTFVFMVGLGYYREESYHIVQLFLRDPGEEEAFLSVLTGLVDRYKLVVTFNGKSFDLPMLNNRYVMNRIRSPFSGFQHVDILHIARKLWKTRLPSRTLGMLENEIIGFFRGEDEVPGWLVPELYLDYLHTGDAAPLKGIFYHNEMDILSLAVLHGVINDMVEKPLEKAAEQVLDMVSIARIYEQSGQIERAIDLYQHSLQRSMPEDIYVQSMKRYGLIYKRKGEWEKAIEIWQQLSQHHQYDACIEIAKYYEHQEKDYPAAIEWTEKAEKMIRDEKTLAYEKDRIEKEIERRRERLSKKIN